MVLSSRLIVSEKKGVTLEMRLSCCVKTTDNPIPSDPESHMSGTDYVIHTAAKS
jgi:hypothetical protein